MAAPAVEGVVITAFRSVLHRVRQAAEQAGRHPEDVRVVAVGKTKPVSLIRHIYDADHRCFGENYVQEIIDKAPQKQKQVIVEKVGEPANGYDNLTANLPADECRYAVYDFDFVTEENVPTSRMFLDVKCL